VDTIYAKDSRGTTFSFLNIIDDATGFQVACCLGELQGPPASRVVLRHFTSFWSSWAGLPHSMQVDRGKEYLANFFDFLKTFGVEQEVIPLGSTLERRKVREGRRSLERSMEEDRFGSKCFWTTSFWQPPLSGRLATLSLVPTAMLLSNGFLEYQIFDYTWCSFG